MNTAAVLFDIDGTLVDSNYLHVHAWHRAFDEVDLNVESWRVHRGIGMDGSTLLDELVPDVADDIRERLSDLHSRFYAETTGLLRPLPGALRLLDAIAASGLQVVLATSAPENELEELRKVLGRDDILSAVTSSEDVETAKPEPGIVQVALERAGVTPDRAVFVGDSVWDLRAAARAEVACICFESGGTDRHRLLDEGAIAVYSDPADLAEQLDGSLIGTWAAETASRA